MSSTSRLEKATTRYGRTGRGATRLSLGTRLAGVLLLIIASCLAGAGPASAAAAHAAQFSPYISPNGWNFYGCTIKAGPAYDALHPAPNYHQIGAGSVSCGSFRRIAITVRQWRDSNGFDAGGVVQEVSTPGSFGTLTVSSVWVPTGPACKSGLARAAFSTGVYVTIDGYGSGWLYSDWKSNASQGC